MHESEKAGEIWAAQTVRVTALDQYRRVSLHVFPKETRCAKVLKWDQHWPCNANSISATTDGFVQCGTRRTLKYRQHNAHVAVQ